MASVEVIGVYPVSEATGPVHLIEIVVRDSSSFDPAEFVQPDPTQPEKNWQVAYDERALDASGNSAITESFELSRRPELLEGDVRLVFDRLRQRVGVHPDVRASKRCRGRAR